MMMPWHTLAVGDQPLGPNAADVLHILGDRGGWTAAAGPDLAPIGALASPVGRGQKARSGEVRAAERVLT